MTSTRPEGAPIGRRYRVAKFIPTTAADAGIRIGVEGTIPIILAAPLETPPECRRSFEAAINAHRIEIAHLIRLGGKHERARESRPPAAAN